MFCAINAKTLQVEFNNEVSEEDQEDATFDVKRGSFATSVEATWAEDGKSVELARSTNLIAGDYTVTVTGLAEEALTGTAKVEAQKITSLEIATNNVIKDATAKVVYNAKDQYGDNMDAQVKDFTWTVINTTDATRTVAKVNETTTNKHLEINTNANAVLDDVLKVSGFLTADPTIKAEKEITVSDEFIKDFELGSIVLPKDQTRLDEATSAYDVELEYTAADNHGEATKLTASQTNATIDNITFVSSNPTLVDPAQMKTDANSKLTFQVASGQSGKATLTALNDNTGVTSSVQIEVFADAVATKVEFGDFKDGLPLIAGETDGTAKLEVTFIDQYGEAIKPAKAAADSALGKFNVSVTGAGTFVSSSIALSSDGKYLEFPEQGATKGTYTLTLVNTAKGHSASIDLVVNEARVPAELLVKTAPDATIVETSGTTDVVFNVKDQYGKDVAVADLGSYTIEATIKDGNVKLNPDVATTPINTTGNYTVAIESATVGTDKVTFELKDGAGEVIGTQVFDIEVVADVASIDATVDKDKYNAGETATVTIKVQKNGPVTHTEYNKTEAVEIEVGASGKKYLRTVTFVEGVATTTVPVEVAGATTAIKVTLGSNNDTETVEVKALEASKLAVDGSDKLYVSDVYGNKVKYNFEGIAVVDTDGTFNGNLDAENQVLVKIVDGDIKEGSTDLTFTGAGKTLTLTLANGDVFVITAK